MGGGEIPFLPAVLLLAQLTVSIIDMNRDLGRLDLRSHPKPIVVSFEKLLPDGLFLPYPKVATPVIFAHLIAFLDVRLGRLKGKRVGVIDRSAGSCNLEHQQRQGEAGAAKCD